MTSDLVVDDFYNPGEVKFGLLLWGRDNSPLISCTLQRTSHPFVEFGLVIKYEYNEIVWPRDPSSEAPEGEWRPLERSAALLGKLIEISPNPTTPCIPHF